LEIRIGERGWALTLINSSVLRRGGGTVIEATCGDGRFESRPSVIQGDCYDAAGCSGSPTWSSLGYNIESPGDTCGFDQTGDQTSVPDPMLGPLQDNGGPTMTHALLPSSVAIDKIPVEDCVDMEGAPLMTDQRGVARRRL
jgi:hypothetical protein